LNVIRFFFKKCDYMTVMKEELLISSGEETDKVYLILSGQMQGYFHDTEKLIDLYDGEYFGGIVANVKQIYSIKAAKTSKLAVLERSAYLYL